MEFFKYHGTGNDFIVIDNRNNDTRPTNNQVAAMCHRRFGIGADGLMLLESASAYDFSMVYYNADGNESSMCGNGGRCLTAFAKHLGIIDSAANFIATDGDHSATIDENDIITLQMTDVHTLEFLPSATVLNTGSPHYVSWVKDAKTIDVFQEGRKIRQSEPYIMDGINVNFAQIMPGGQLFVRTYERGVEDETLSCGTGVVASAIASTCSTTGNFYIGVETPGGHLNVSFRKQTPQSADQIYLSGPAILVFKGNFPL